ncbi:LptF/LptG family permease [Chitinispirillales bacterium ANBcel5]|uniref:LptF/LptG family permease n=1 Tax=Cellulosispirillum alkaliphilum TaxID=3039283 RepID=UPI002A540F41|nr:LptF/LptG family permease [Chitinispirillales bacterium ANBcel5]
MLIYRYIIRELIFPFIASLGIIVFLFIMQQAMVLLNRIVSRGLDPAVVFEIFVIQLGWILALAIPMAVLTSTLMTFGRMSGDNEITAIKASGSSMFPLLIPVFSAGLVVTVGLFYFHDLILPEANHRASKLLSDISRTQPAAFIEPGVLIQDFEDYTLYTHDVDPVTGDLSGIRIMTDAAGQDPTVTVAASGNVRMTNDQRFLKLTLHNGETHSYPRDADQEYYIGEFEKQVIYIQNVDSRLQRTESDYRGNREKTIAMMLSDVEDLREANQNILVNHHKIIDTLSAQMTRYDSLNKVLPYDSEQTDIMSFDKWIQHYGKSIPVASNEVLKNKDALQRVIRRKHSNDLSIAQYMVEVHKKYAIPAAVLLFVLIGAPLGIMAKRGGLAVGGSYSLFFFIIYWAFLIVGESWADNLIISPFLGMWSGNILIAIAGLVLLYFMLQEKTIRFDFVKHFFAFLTKNQLIKSISKSFIFKIPGIIFLLPKIITRKCIKILPTYLMGQFLSYTIGLLIAVLVIFVVVDYVSNLRRFEHATLLEALLYYWYYLPWLIQTMLPVVLLLASMFAMGKLVKQSELTAIKAAGVNIRQLTFPLLGFALFLSVAAFYGGEVILPLANERRAELSEQFRHPPSMRDSRQPGRREYRRNFFYFGDPNTMYVFKEFSTNPQFARQIQRLSFREDGLMQRIDAEEMVYDENSGWKFLNGQIRSFGRKDSILLTFDTLDDDVLTSKPHDMVKYVRSKREMSYWELKNYIEISRQRGEQVQRHKAELHFKIALPLMNFLVILLGVAITARTGRKGGPINFAIGLMMVFAYWIISRSTMVLAQNGTITPLAGAWIGNIIFTVIGIILYRKAAH